MPEAALIVSGIDLTWLGWGLMLKGPMAKMPTYYRDTATQETLCNQCVFLHNFTNCLYHAWDTILLHEYKCRTRAQSACIAGETAWSGRAMKSRLRVANSKTRYLIIKIIVVALMINERYARKPARLLRCWCGQDCVGPDSSCKARLTSIVRPNGQILPWT